MEIDRSARILEALGGRDGDLYSAAFTAVAISAAQDVFSIAAPANRYVRIRNIWVGQYSDFGPDQSEILSVALIRGHTTVGSGGSVLTPVPMRPGSGPAKSVVRANDTTIASNGSTLTPVARAWNVQTEFLYEPRPVESIVLSPSERLVVRISAPTDGITTNGTLGFEEFVA